MFKRFLVLSVLLMLLAWSLPGQADVKSLSGSVVTLSASSPQSCSNPGSNTFYFQADSYTNDYGYVYDVWLKFPSGWTVTNVAVIGTPVCDSGYYGTMSWTLPNSPNEVDIYHPRYQSFTDHCVATYSVTVSVGAPAPAEVSWYWLGDDYGSAPYHPCSNDNYTPVCGSCGACDEMVNPPVSIASCGNPSTITGTVTDLGHGYPLYARIDIAGLPDPIFTDPMTGAYSILLVEGIPFDFTVTPFMPGYQPEVRTVTPPPGSGVEDFVLGPDASCTAPGYDGSCNPIAGGLLVGNVMDVVTSDPINDATITSDNAPIDTTTSEETPLDPNLSDGFYSLFSSITGTTPVTATAVSYGTDTETPTVVSDGVVWQDFYLLAGFIMPDPDLLEVWVGLGNTFTTDLTLYNVGGGDVNFSITEGNGASALQKGKGAPLKTIKANVTTGPAINKSAMPDKSLKLKVLDPPWTNIANYPLTTMDGAAVNFGGLVYNFGGLSSGGFTGESYVYDPETDAWTSIGSMSNAIEKPAVAEVNGLIYITNGWNSSGGTNAVLDIYDPASGTWTTGTSNPFAQQGGGVGVGIDGKAYYLGGYPGTNTLAIYDPATDSWSTGAPYPETIMWQSCGNLDGKMICSGGIVNSGGTETVNTYLYDPGANSWTMLAPMPINTWASAYAAMDGKFYVSGGVIGGNISNAGYGYDPGTDSWSPIENGNITLYRSSSACGLYRIGGDVGGFVGSNLCEVHPGLGGCLQDVPWLSEDPTEGTVPVGGSTPVAVTFDTTVPEVPTTGDYFAHLHIGESSPYPVPDVNVIMHVISCPTITIDQSALPDGTVGVAYDQTVTASGGTAPYTFAITAGALPGGLTLSADGNITGVPTTAGTFDFDITAFDADNCPGTASFTINIACAPITISPATLPNAQLTVAYDQQLTASGGGAPYTFAVTSGALPDGLAMDTTGHITGTPTVVADFTFEVTATDAGGCTGTQSYMITVSPACLWCDDFNDSVIGPDWLVVKPSWSEAGGMLIGTPTKKKAVIIAEGFAGCLTCNVEAEMMTAGGQYNKMWLYGWYTDKRNTIEMLVKQENNKVVLRQRVNQYLVAKAKASVTIEPNVPFIAKITFDGTNLVLNFNGVDVLSLHPLVNAMAPETFGFGVKNTTGSFNYITVNNN